MCRSVQSYPGLNLGTLLKKCSVICAAVVWVQLCMADPSWVKGPAQVSLGDYGQLEIPGGFKFANPDVAQAFLKSASSSGKILGIVMPDTEMVARNPALGEWYIRFEYFDTGHISDMTDMELKEDAILSSLQPQVQEMNDARESRGQPKMAKVGWELKPIYHSREHSLEWAWRGEGMAPLDTVFDYTSRFLTRRGTLQAHAAVFRGGNFGLDAIHEILATMRIKTGETYAEFKPGDKVASGGLATLANTVLGQPSNRMDRAGSENVGGTKVVWMGFVLLGGVGLVGGGILAKKLRRQRAANFADSDELAGTSAPASARTRNGFKLNVSRALKLPKPAKANANGGNGHSASHNGNGNGQKRKRMFNYHKFYTEMVLQGPSPMVAESYSPYELDILRYQNGYAANGNPPAEGNGHSNGTNGHNGAAESNAVIAAHTELIASQRTLIEEQKRLIQEQARLIEEKTRLIAEKEQLLGRAQGIQAS